MSSRPGLPGLPVHRIYPVFADSRCPRWFWPGVQKSVWRRVLELWWCVVNNLTMWNALWLQCNYNFYCPSWPKSGRDFYLCKVTNVHLWLRTYYYVNVWPAILPPNCASTKKWVKMGTMHMKKQAAYNNTADISTYSLFVTATHWSTHKVRPDQRVQYNSLSIKVNK